MATIWGFALQGLILGANVRRIDDFGINHGATLGFQQQKIGLNSEHWEVKGILTAMKENPIIFHVNGDYSGAMTTIHNKDLTIIGILTN